jgi:hypothetical protein
MITKTVLKDYQNSNHPQPPFVFQVKLMHLCPKGSIGAGELQVFWVMRSKTHYQQWLLDYRLQTIDLKLGLTKITPSLPLKKRDVFHNMHIINVLTFIYVQILPLKTSIIDNN